jgi:hypothetical protein
MVRAVRGRDSEWAVAGVRAAEELVVAGELEAPAVQGAVGLAAPAYGILAWQAAAKALARVDPAGEVAPEAGLAVEAEELAGLAEVVRGAV